MKLKHSILRFTFFLFLFSISLTCHTVHASAAKEPDNVVIVDQDVDQLIDDDFVNMSDLTPYLEIYDFTKDIQVTYGNLCFHAFLSNDGTHSWIHDIDQLLHLL